MTISLPQKKIIIDKIDVFESISEPRNTSFRVSICVRSADIKNVGSFSAKIYWGFLQQQQIQVLKNSSYKIPALHNKELKWSFFGGSKTLKYALEKISFNMSYKDICPIRLKIGILYDINNNF